ncbi:AraC family transcriptional regulator [Acetobacter farinalis]|uniref:AraC family transcriptional regulator n=1 Tax=Acetobacter farinalis TaxID=1260984 RepID=A0ABT3Q6P2_9PROT|nr:AraC family transcriptional regulator [Acetobacter farinalis]MCX2560959.1 AraC family transcriptional regulator [Acetobacter farinalis]NHO29608.1 helix-turn-helix domain-containing protein [Acetobacter farinalis]
MSRSPGTGGNASVLAAAAWGVERFVKERGGDMDRIAGRAGLSTDQLSLPTDALDVGSYCRLFHEAAADTQDGNIGLWFGQQFAPEKLGLIGYVALLSPTLSEALQNLTSHFAYHQARTTTRFVQQDDLVRLEYAIHDPTILTRRHDAELTMGMFRNILRHALGPDWAPEEVHFEHKQPEQAEEHRQAFQADIRFQCATNALVFRKTVLTRAMPDADAAMLDVMRASLISLARSRPDQATAHLSLKDRVILHIRAALEDGHIEFPDIAARMQLPPWTLQRRLAQLHLSYSTLLEETRHAEALRHLASPTLDISEIARALAYTETSAFSRAFRKWSGQSPRAWRHQNALTRL